MIGPLTRPSLARAWFAATVVVVLVAVGIQLPVAAGGTGGFFTAPLDRALNVFAYFTIQSNLLVALSALLTALQPDRDGTARRVLRLTALVAITVTGVVYHLLLAGLVELEGWALLSDELLHTVVPLLAVGGWLLFGPRRRTSWPVVGLSLVFPLAWTVLTLVRGPLVGGFWPYPFVDVGRLGWGQVAVNLVVVAVLFVGLASAALGADRLLARAGDRRADPARSG